MRNTYVRLGLAILMVAGGLSASESQSPGEPGALPAVAVLTFSSTFRYTTLDPGTAAANYASAALVQSKRFRVFDRTNLLRVLDEHKVKAVGIVASGEAAQIGGLAEVDYLVMGDVQTVDFSRSRTGAATGCKVRVHLVYVGVTSGERAADSVVDGEANTGVLGGSESDVRLVDRALQSAADQFVRSVVSGGAGTVTAVVARGDALLIQVNIGRLDGIGEDVDVAFARDEVLKGPGGEVVIGPDGRPERMHLPVAAMADKKHRAPTPCIGQPRHIEPRKCLVDVGYYREWKVAGHVLSRTFRSVPDMAKAIRVGDFVTIMPRPKEKKGPLRL